MGIAQFAVTRPVAVIMRIAALVLLGAVCLTRLPVDLDKTMGVKLKWGIGMEAEKYPLLGHPASTGAVMRIWPEKELVIVLGRFRRGDNWRDHEYAFLNACLAPFGEQIK
jgi:hypothetical protein